MKMSEKEKILGKITFKSARAEKRFLNMLDQTDPKAEELLLKAIYQNGHTVRWCKIGETKVSGRREVLYVDALDLNNQSLIYRVDLINGGHCCDRIGMNIRKGWKPVTVW